MAADQGEVAAPATASISPQQASKVLKADLANMVKKVASGKTLSTTERAILTSLSGGDGMTAAPATAIPTYAKKQSELATILGFKDRKTIQRWLREPGNPGRRDDGRYDVSAWMVYARTKGHECPGDTPPEDLNQTRAKARQILLQNEKLELQLGILRKEYLPIKDIEQDVTAMVLAAKRILLSGPASLAPQVVGVSIPEAEKLLRQWLHDALALLSANPGGEE